MDMLHIIFMLKGKKGVAACYLFHNEVMKKKF